MNKNKIIKEFIVAVFPTLSNLTKAELIDAIASGSKLTKADAGRIVKKMTDQEIFRYVFGMKKTELIDAIASSAKLTKADAGRALDATIESIHKSLKGKK